MTLPTIPIELMISIFAMAQLGLLTAIFFRLGKLVAIVEHHDKRLVALENQAIVKPLAA